MTSFRKSTIHATTLASVAAWLRIGELGLYKLQLPEYNKETFKENLGKVKEWIKDQPEDFPLRLQQLCAAAGVGLIYTPSLSKAPISGATRWVGGRPLIQLTDRYKWNDQFWFTFFHEVGHVLLHGKKEVFLEDLEGYEEDMEKEGEANDFAGNYLLPDSFLKELKDEGEITEQEVRRIARVFGTHPGIVVGRLQRLNKVTHFFGNNLKSKVFLDPFFAK
jgi:Zn-dependent peptidase ImmA (M78 family)